MFLLVLVSRNSAAITFTLPPLKNLVIGLFKIFSMLISELVWILANCYASTLQNFARRHFFDVNGVSIEAS